MRESTIEWLLEGDVSIQYQTYRDLLGEIRTDLRSRVATEGWGSEFLRRRNGDGSWGRGFYQPKWTSTHYTLLDLKALQFDPGHQAVGESVRAIARNQKGRDGGINGMYLNYACYFGEWRMEGSTARGTGVAPDTARFTPRCPS